MVQVLGATVGDFVSFAQAVDCAGAASSHFVVNADSVVGPVNLAAGFYSVCYSTSAATQDSDYGFCSDNSLYVQATSKPCSFYHFCLHKLFKIRLCNKV